jgi:hypothetical protein
MISISITVSPLRDSKTDSVVCMEHSPSSETNSQSANQDIHHLLWNNVHNNPPLVHILYDSSVYFFICLSDCSS